jgi:hypothetical protein
VREEQGDACPSDHTVDHRDHAGDREETDRRALMAALRQLQGLVREIAGEG